MAAQPERAGWSGYLDLTGSGWFRAREVAFRVTTKDEGVTLVVGNRVLLDCVGLATPPGTYNCGSNQDVSKKLWPGMRPITIEYAELSGDASFRLEWKIDPMSSMSQWEVVPASAVRTNLGLLTRTIRDAAFDPEVSRTIYAYADDDAKTRHLPSAITGKDSATAVERRTEYTYNPYGQTRSVTTAAGTALAATTRFDYVNDSTTSCLQQVTVPLSAADQAAQTGAVTTYACDEAGHVTSQTQIVRAVAGTEQLAQTRTTTSEYDSLGRVTKVTTPLGGSTTTLYDAAGRPEQIREYLGTGAGHDAEVTTSYAYDDAGHLLSETLPPVRDPVSGQMVNPVILHSWDWLDDEVATTDERGKTWSYAYDAFRRLIQTTSPEGLVTRTEFRLSTAPSGGACQHRTTVWSPPGDPGLAGTVATVTSYNVRGWTDSVQVGTLYGSTTYMYDPLGRQTRETTPWGVKTSFTYDGFDQVTVRTDFFQSATPASTGYEYDPARRLSELDGPRTDEDDSLTYGYDLAGNLVRVTQNGITLPGTSTVVTTDLVFNDAGEQIQLRQPLTETLTQVRDWVVDPSARTSTYVETRGSTVYTTTSHLNEAGWIDSVDDPRGTVLRFEYDNLGRRTRRYAEAGGTTDDQRFAYDLAGNTVSATVQATGTTVGVDYDDDGRAWKVYQASPTPTTTYAYDPSTGRPASVQDTIGATTLTTSFNYTANGLLWHLYDPFGSSITYTYDIYGRVTQRQDTPSSGTGLCWKQHYELGRVDWRKIRQGGCSGTVLVDLTLTYDLASNITSRYQWVKSETGSAVAESGTWGYDYDGAGRMQQATKPSGVITAYAYDGGGNRISVQVGTDPAVTTSYDSGGLPVSSSDGTTYTHDEAGYLAGIDRSAGPDGFFTYDAWGGLTEVAPTQGGQAQVTYTTDALGRTLSRTEAGTTTGFTYRGTTEDVVSSQSGAGTPVYISLGPAGPISRRVGTSQSTLRFYLRDLHTDVVALAGTSGSPSTVKGAASSDPWGTPIALTGELSTSSPLLGFQADVTDPATGQVDMGARWYEPTLGRFTSADVLQGDPTSPISLNRYLYGVANPVTFMDPTGLSAATSQSSGGEHCGRVCQERVEDLSEQTWKDSVYERYDWTIDFIYTEMIQHADMYVSRREWDNSMCWFSVVSCWFGAQPRTLVDFGWNERQGGPWDHKDALRQGLGLTAEDEHFPIRGVSDYEVYFDVWSNIHYGYVGRAAGSSSTELRVAAELAGYLSGGTNDAADVISVDIGIELWEGRGLTLVPGDIQRALIAHIGDYEAAQLTYPRIRVLQPAVKGNGF